MTDMRRQRIESIAILGTGRMGAALGGRLAGLGYSITYGSREPRQADVIERVRRSGADATVTTVAEAAAAADCVVFAIPYKAMASALEEVGDLHDTLVLDPTNALVPADDGLMQMAVEDSSAERLQLALPHAKVVKAFNTVGFHVIDNPEAAGGAVTVPLAGNDADAKQRAAALVRDLGFEAMDVGPLRHAHALEAMASLYLVPYLSGRREDAFEFYLRKGASPTSSSGVRAAG